MEKNNTNKFENRHIGPNSAEVNEMIKTIGVSSLGTLINETVPNHIRKKETLNLPEAASESEFLAHIKELAKQNKPYQSFIGCGYYNCITPPRHTA